MNDENTLSPADKLKQALEAKNAKRAGGFNGQLDTKAEEKSVAKRNNAMNKPAFKRMSKRG